MSCHHHQNHQSLIISEGVSTPFLDEKKINSGKGWKKKTLTFDLWLQKFRVLSLYILKLRVLPLLINTQSLEFDELVQERCNPIANALELDLNFTNPSNWNWSNKQFGCYCINSNYCMTLWDGQWRRESMWHTAGWLKIKTFRSCIWKIGIC